MTILLPTLAVAFAALYVWLTVRIVNRREQWAKWTLAAVVVMPVLYVASFGPACWISSYLLGSGDDSTVVEAEAISMLYRPLLRPAWSGRTGRVLTWYAMLWSNKDWTTAYDGEKGCWGRYPQRDL